MHITIKKIQYKFHEQIYLELPYILVFLTKHYALSKVLL